MIDRKKVLTGLECLITDEVPCEGCPYSDGSYCVSGIAKDAFELLKEQEAVSPNIKTNVNGIYYVCGNCGEMMFGYKYCPTCGRRVKWDAKTD